MELVRLLLQRQSWCCARDQVVSPLCPRLLPRAFSSLQELSRFPFILDDLERRVTIYKMELKGMDLMAMDMLEAMEAAKVRTKAAGSCPLSLPPLLPFPVVTGGHDQHRK